METAQDVELRALIEKLAPEDMPEAAALLLEAWWRAHDSAGESVYEFYRRITEHHSGELRRQLDHMSATYSSGRLLSPETGTPGPLD